MRAIVRLLLAFCWVAITFSYRIIGLILAPVAPRANHYFRRSAFRLCAKGILKISGIRLTVQGTPPKAPFYLVSNHITFIDVFVLASELGCVFVSKSELGNWPVLSFITRTMNTILINREDLRDTRRVNDQIKEIMEQEMGIVVFIEGTVTETGELLPFKPALLQPAVELDMPVHYASIQYETPYRPEAAQESILWKKNENVIKHYLKCAAVPFSNASLVFGNDPLLREDRKILAADLHEAVKEIHTPIT